MNEQWLEHLPLKDIKEISRVSGGDVNEAYRVETDTDTFFLLVQRGRKESFYAAEIAGLNEFERAGITAPRVIASGEVNGDAYLVMTYLEEGASGSQRQLGQLVAQLHSQQQEEGKFGFSLPYEGGDISFDNHWQDDWCTIFVDKRMDHLKDELLNRGLWDANDIKVYDKVRRQIVAELEKHQSKPSLLHGDLWGVIICSYKMVVRRYLIQHHYMVTENLISVLQRYLVVLRANFMMRIINIIHSQKVHPIDLNFIVYIY